MHSRLPRVWVGWGIVCALFSALAPSRTSASWISEISPANRAIWTTAGEPNQTDLPPYIEITLTSPRSSQLDLVLIDASTSISRYGKILSVFSIIISPTATTHLLIDNSAGNATPWPTDIDTAWTLVQNNATLSATALNISTNLPRSLMLFDGPTLLTSSGAPKIQTVSWNNATLVDVVTFGPGGLAKTFPGNDQVSVGPFGETVLDLGDGQIIARPLSDLQTPSLDPHLVGVADQDNLLTNVTDDLGLLLNPGLVNLSAFNLTSPPPSPPHMPEPSTFCLGLGLLLTCRRTRGPTHLRSTQPMQPTSV